MLLRCLTFACGSGFGVRDCCLHFDAGFGLMIDACALKIGVCGGFSVCYGFWGLCLFLGALFGMCEFNCAGVFLCEGVWFVVSLSYCLFCGCLRCGLGVLDMVCLWLYFGFLLWVCCLLAWWTAASWCS